MDEPNHDGFTVKMSEMSCSDIKLRRFKENGNEIYNSNFTKATTLTVKAYHNSRYEVIIQTVQQFIEIQSQYEYT